MKSIFFSILAIMILLPGVAIADVVLTPSRSYCPDIETCIKECYDCTKGEFIKEPKELDKWPFACRICKNCGSSNIRAGIQKFCPPPPTPTCPGIHYCMDNCYNCARKDFSRPTPNHQKSKDCKHCNVCDQSKLDARIDKVCPTPTLSLCIDKCFDCETLHFKDGVLTNDHDDYQLCHLCSSTLYEELKAQCQVLKEEAAKAQQQETVKDEAAKAQQP